MIVVNNPHDILYCPFHTTERRTPMEEEVRDEASTRSAVVNQTCRRRPATEPEPETATGSVSRQISAWPLNQRVSGGARARCRVQDVLLRPRAVLSRFLTGERPTLRGGAQLVTPQESLASMQTHSVEWGNRAGSCVPDRYQMKLASWCSKMNAVLTSGI